RVCYCCDGYGKVILSRLRELQALMDLPGSGSFVRQKKNIMKRFTKISFWPVAALIPFAMTACKKDDNPGHAAPQIETLAVENVLASKPLVESGTFQGTGSPALIMPGQSTTITFSAAKGEALSFATMYGWSNDLFFAPANPGIQVYDNTGTPIEGDVS